MLEKRTLVSIILVFAESFVIRTGSRAVLVIGRVQSRSLIWIGKMQADRERLRASLHWPSALERSFHASRKLNLVA
jgi:hypothetical protein